MKVQFLHLTRLRSALLIVIILVFFGQNQARADFKVPDIVPIIQEISLMEAIHHISEQYQVLFNYDRKIVSGVKVQYEPEKFTNVDEAITAVLKETDLKYQIFNQRYVVLFKNDKEGIESLKEMIEHFQTIVDDREDIVTARKNIRPSPTLVSTLSRDLISEMNISFSIEGAVTDQDGEPLIGVNIQVKGDNLGTSTDFEGRFSLENIDENAVLVVSYIGYQTQEVAVAGKSSLSITMVSDSQLLDEVVVVGYSSKKQSELSSAVSIVQSKDLEGVTTDNLGEMLQGKVPGVRISNATGRPGHNPQIVIRGVGSINAGSSPLVVVDGIIGGTYNPSDIKTITVLKDAAATGLYGSRAANGVLVITTKSGSTGKTSIQFQASHGLNYHNDGNLDFMNATELYNYHKTAATNSYNLLENPSQSLDEFLASSVPSSVLDHKTNWQDLLKRMGSVSKYQISLSGGNENTTFYISGNYFNEIGTMINMEYRRLDIRSNISHRISDIFRVDLRVAANHDRSPNEPQGGQEGLYGLYHIAMPYDRPFHDDGTPVDPFDPDINWYGNSRSNYFFNREHYKDITNGLNTSGDIQLTANIADWITFTTTNRLTFHSSERNQLFDKFHALGSSAGGIARDNISYNYSILTSNKLNLSKRFDSHSFKGIIGQEYNHVTNKFLTAEGMDLPLGLEAINSVGSPSTIGGNRSEFGFKSYFAQLDYNYNSKYYLIASYRKDASSRFGKDNRWGDFYAVGASWMINRENFLQNSTWIDLFKLKLSYGLTGNANIGNYLSLSSYNFSGGYAGNPAAVPSRIANPNLTWEIAHTTNMGIELFAFERFEISVDYYVRENRNLLQDVPLSAATGFSSQRKNIGTVKNKGVDIFLSSDNLTGDFNWITTFNVSFNDSEIINLDGGKDISSGNMRFSEGRPLRTWYMREWAGVDSENGDPLWVRWEDEEGNLLNQSGGIDQNHPAEITLTNNSNEASLLFIGSPYPDFIGGMRNEFGYKGFTLSVLTNFAYGNTIFTGLRTRMDSDGAFTSHNKIKLEPDWSRWEKPGDVATHPLLLFNGNKNSYTPSSRYIEDASFFRIQNIRLSYVFDQLGGVLFDNLGLSLSLDNVKTWTKYSGADPAVNMENPVSTQNANNGSYAPPTSIVFGINVNF